MFESDEDMGMGLSDIVKTSQSQRDKKHTICDDNFINTIEGTDTQGIGSIDNQPLLLKSQAILLES